MEQNEYDEFNSALENITNRKKISFANALESHGEKLLLEIEKKKIEKDKIKEEEIKFIIEKTKNKYSVEELIDYHYNDIHDLYLEIKDKNKSKIVNIIKFIFNLNK